MTGTPEKHYEIHLPADVIADHRRAGAHTAGLVRRVTAADLDRPTPCGDWDVRALLTHLVSENLWVAPLVAGATIADIEATDGARLHGDVLGDDWAAAFDASLAEACTAFEASGARSRPVAVSYGPIPAEAYAGHRFLDLLIHGWDLAVAIGADATLDPDLAADCWTIVEPDRAMLAASGLFGDHVDAADAAPIADRLLAALGRRMPGTEGSDHGGEP